MSFRKAPTRVSATIGGKEIILETGRVATQAHGSVTIQCGGTVVLVTVLAVALHHVLGLLAGYVTAKVFRFNEKKVRALSLEVGLQNSGLSCTLAKTAFPDTMAILPCVIATVVHQIIGPIVASMFAAKPLSEEAEPVSEKKKAKEAVTA